MVKVNDETVQDLTILLEGGTELSDVENLEIVQLLGQVNHKVEVILVCSMRVIKDVARKPSFMEEVSISSVGNDLSD